MNLLEIKFSALGSFDQYEMSPDFVSKLALLYTKYNMIPNTITLQEVTNSGIKLKYRPQLIHISSGTYVNILPDRIDVFIQSNKGAIDIDDFSKYSNRIFDDLSDLIEDKPLRFATVVKGFIENVTQSEIINQTNFYNDDRFVEWMLRSVVRKDIEINGRNEKINIVITQETQENGIIINGSGPFNGTVYLIDINTVQPSVNGAFNIKDFHKFNIAINDELKLALNRIEGVKRE